MNATTKSPEFQRKQACADRLQAIVEQQVYCGREIQQSGYNPSPVLRARMDSLIEAYQVADRELAAAEALCDEPVFVRPVR